jgi:hypothetical protein
MIDFVQTECADRISIAECRAILGTEGVAMTDEEIIGLRDSMYAIGEIAVDNFEMLSKLAS